MKLETYPAVEPLWPYGTVAFFYVKAKGDDHSIGVRELVIRAAEPIEGGGWRVMASLPDTMYDPEGREYVFEVDSNGEAASCVPWDDDLEKEFNPRMSRYTSVEPAVRFSEPGDPGDGETWEVFDREAGTTRREGFDPDAGWTIKASAPPVEWLEEVTTSGVHN